MTPLVERLRQNPNLADELATIAALFGKIVHPPYPTPDGQPLQVWHNDGSGKGFQVLPKNQIKGWVKYLQKENLK